MKSKEAKSEKTKSKFLFYLGKMGKWSNLLMQTDIIKKKKSSLRLKQGVL
ncbi:hypothetical protein BFO_0630 [Tannerella forsythia 92A2]|uniref:Uncharacterized protein n=1 Tax=Tannerella forsythia (strain ATCC 43037 / JCM 10827 / CCUG 21028 A / KCTC 5666 / FDC 338) TaxID=203275 RepID=G8UME7_TANFA|nr:hypothetical protein BFO_0630 [Tannerella forsythia 92A2]